MTQTEQPVPETEAPDAGKREEQSDARDANLTETADLEEDEEVKVQDVQDVQEVQEVQEVEEVKEVQKTQKVEEVEPTVEQKQEEAKLEVIDVVMDKDVEMPNQNEIEVAAAAGSGRRLWKPDTFEQDVDDMLKKRKLKMGTARSSPLESQTVQTVTAARLLWPSWAWRIHPCRIWLQDRRIGQRPGPPGSMRKSTWKSARRQRKKADEKVEKADKEMEQAQGGLHHTVLVCWALGRLLDTSGRQSIE